MVIFLEEKCFKSMYNIIFRKSNVYMQLIYKYPEHRLWSCIGDI